MKTIHEEALDNSFYEAVERTPKLAASMAQVRRRIMGGGFYCPDMVDASFQKWERNKNITLIDAYGFTQIWGYILTGAVAHCSVPLPSFPETDRSIDFNQSVLDQLPNGFSASFSPKMGRGADDDGVFTIGKGIGLWRTFMQDDETTRDESWISKESHHVPIEVGSTKVSKTLYHLRCGSGVARWPYGHNKIIVLLGLQTHFSYDTSKLRIQREKSRQ